MKKYLLFATLSALSGTAFSENLFTCSNLSGQAYYPYRGLVPKDKAGWTKDAISGGSFTLTKTADHKFDLLYTDSTKRVVSTIADGGSVIALGTGKDYASILVNYPDKTVETYFYYLNADGNYEVLFNQVKYNTPVSKAAIMKGACVRS